MIARAAFSHLMDARAQAVASGKARLITAQAVFRSRLTDEPTATDAAIMTTMADEFPLA